MPDPGIGPVNIAGTALIAQFCIIVIISAAAFLVRAGYSGLLFWEQSPFPSIYPTTIAFGLLTLGMFIFSDEIANVAKPLLGGVNIAMIRLSNALMFVFLVDVIWISLIVFWTGGSFGSPFSPLYFLIPTLAIFLREPLSHIVVYTLSVMFGFSFNLLAPEDSMEAAKRNWAYWIVSMSSLVLATFVGYTTRPK